MKSMTCFTIVALAAMTALPVFADDVSPEEVDLQNPASPSRWRISAGVRFAPGIKADANISTKAIADSVGRLHPLGTSWTTPVPKEFSSTSTTVSREKTSDSTTEMIDLASTGRTDFNGGFIDMNDDAGIPGETANWHFDDGSRFDESTGTIVLENQSSSSHSHESSRSGSSRSATFVSQRSSFSEKVFPDIMSSGEADARGGDVEIGYDFYVGERFLLGLGFGATFYRGEDLVRTAGRCYSASAELRRETTRGHYFESTEVSTTSSSESSSTTIFTDPNLAYDGAGADIVNDDGSIGAGTADGYSNPYGGYNPVLTIGDATVTRSSESSSSTETTVTKTRGFVKDGTSTAVTRRSRTIDVAAQGDVDTHELRLALQPAWQVAKWFELRGSFGAAATRVSVDVNSTVFLDGAVWGTVSDDDEDWIVTGLCGIDAVVSPFEWLSLFVGADVRFGNNRMNYEAGLVKGEIELARNTYRAGVAIRF